MAGYRVVEAANLDEAIRAMEQQPADVVVAALDLPHDGSAALLAAMRRRAEWERIPLLALAESNVQCASAQHTKKEGFQDCQAKFDREGHARVGGAAGVDACFHANWRQSAWERRDKR